MSRPADRVARVVFFCPMQVNVRAWRWTVSRPAFALSAVRLRVVAVTRSPQRWYAVSRRQARRDARRHSAVAPLRTQAPRTSMSLFMACGVWLVRLGAYFVFLRPALLPEDPRFISVPLDRLRGLAPGLEAWRRIVFTVMGGFMTGACVLIVHLARMAMRERQGGTGGAVAFSGLVTVGLMSAMDFVLHSDFRWVLLLPALLWAVAVVLYARQV